MTNTTTATAVRGALLTAAALLALGPAQAASAAPAGKLHGDWLYLTVTRGDARSSDTRGALLLCDLPQGRTHAAEACAELEAADGDIGGIPPKEGALCPMIYAPVTAHARGQWHGRPVEYRKTFSNSCVLAARTGSVFALDS
ncbi:SSI family serine proteinase inhibitor [Streptomyces sp. NPDC001984]